MDMQLIIVEQEHQKRMREHGFRIRPDNIIHVPFKNSGFASRNEGNFVAIELKHRATERDALADYENPSNIINVLG